MELPEQTDPSAVEVKIEDGQVSSTGDGQLVAHKETKTSSKTPGSSSGCVFRTYTVAQLVVSLVLGFAFGVALEKTRVFEPKSIRLQMVFDKWIMLKMFLAALATSTLCLGILSLLPFTERKFRHACDAFVTCFNSKGVVTSCLGAFVLGVGMTICGACPGMVLAQVGTWVPNAIFTLTGCVVGALVYGVVAPMIDPYIRPRRPFVHQQVHTRFNQPFAVFAIPMAVGICVVVILLEIFIDYREDLERPEDLGYDIVRTIAWPPYVGGIIIGVLQIPMVMLLEDTIGGSSSYVTIASLWVVTSKLQQKFPYLAGKRTGVGNWWQVVYVSGAILGGLSSAAASDSLGETQGVGILEAFFGGLLMLLGARLAAGCTSGHGISGASLLVWLSFLAVPFMFGGAVVTAFIMRAAGGSLDRLVNSTLSL